MDPSVMGGKFDIPGWIKHIPTQWGCDSTVAGSFKGYDSAHMYSFPGKIGYTYTFKFAATYSFWKGAVLAVYDAESGERVAHKRKRWDNDVKLVYAAERDVKYLVAVYSVSWWATGNYTLGAECKVTGCKVNTECGQGEYCHFAPGGCGASQGAGSCKAMPQACYKIYKPVCGCDGNTYGNDCVANAAGTSVDHVGPCNTAPETKCESNGGYCAHFLDSCKKDYISTPPGDCPLGKSGQCCLPAVLMTNVNKGYTTEEQVSPNVTNNMQQSIFLDGCSVFAWEQKVSGGWISHGPEYVCVWEGYAKEHSGGAYGESLAPRKAGTWRVTATYGVGCKAGLPLSQAGCSSFETVKSIPFLVKDCPKLSKPDPLTFCPDGTIEPKYDKDGICITGYDCLLKCKTTGCSGQLCSHKTIVTTCDVKPWYGCFASSECGNFGANGACGWKQTPALKACLAKFGI